MLYGWSEVPFAPGLGGRFWAKVLCRFARSIDADVVAAVRGVEAAAAAADDDDDIVDDEGGLMFFILNLLIKDN